MISKYKTIHILLINVHLDCSGGGGGSNNRNASRDESVETGDESVKAGDESIEAEEKTQQSCYNSSETMLVKRDPDLSGLTSIKKSGCYQLHNVACFH